MDLYTFAWIFGLIVILWLYTSLVLRSFPTLTGKRILLLTAHPDDECMFFSPTILALTRPELGNQLKILCLSTGNADGIGDLRRKELLKSAEILGLSSEDDVLNLDNPDFQDGPHTWDRQSLSKLLLSFLAPDLGRTNKYVAVKTFVDVIITFDKHGVSQHPNHISCYFGVEDFLKALTKGREGWACPVAAYSLTSISMGRKYISVLDCVFTFMSAVWKFGRIGSSRQRSTVSSGPSSLRETRIDTVEARLTVLLFVSGFMGWVLGLRAMIFGHWSQMLWFRWGWIGLGRYMIVNDLRKIDVT